MRSAMHTGVIASRKTERVIESRCKKQSVADSKNLLVIEWTPLTLSPSYVYSRIATSS